MRFDIIIYLALLLFLPFTQLNASTTYKVEQGDTLYSIARKFNTSVQSIKDANSLYDNNIKIGQRLYMPTYDVSHQKQENKTPSSATILSNGIYTVKSGDTLSQVADRFGVLTSELRTFNYLSSDKLHIGQELKLPYITVKSSNTVVITVSGEKIKEPKTTIAKTESVIEEPVVTKSTNDDQHSSSYQSVYIVKSGDNLSQVAERLGVLTKDLKSHNHLSSDKLHIGQKLKIPYITIKSSTQVASSNNNSKSSTSSSTKTQTYSSDYSTYTVQSGDTVNQIAERFNVKSKVLKNENHLSNNNIYVGQKLRIPDTSNYTSTQLSKTEVSKKISDPKIENSKTDIYVVVKGDTLHSIARKFGTNISTIKRFNDLSSDNLKIGYVLKVPSSSVTYSKSGNLIYTVSKGDSLGVIAENFGVAVSSIKSTNGLKDNNIKVGSKLKIPNKKTSYSKTKTKAKQSGTKTNTSLIKYIVKKGDTLSSIARRHNTTISSIKKTNNLNNSYIYNGQKLNIHSKIKKSSTVAKKSSKRRTHGNKKQVTDELIKVAKKYIGAPYKFGGTSTKTGIDCSAYVNKVFSFFDVNLPRTARGMFRKGNWVSKNQLEKGDLVFFRTYAKFPSHVGIYLGNNKFIHASSAKKRVTITNLNRSYYQKRYIGAKRIPLKGLFYEQYSKNFKGFEKQFN